MSGGISPVSGPVNSLSSINTGEGNVSSSEDSTGQTQVDRSNLASELKQIQNSLQLLQPEQPAGNQLDVEA